MKTKFTRFFKRCAFAAFVLYGGVVSAATYTAVSSGSWSSTSTWSGGLAPGGSIGSLDNVVINSGVTVTMDMNVTVSSILSSLQVNGTLNSTGSYMLDMNSGALSGNGTLNLAHLRFGSLGTMTFTGTAHVDHMHNNNASLSIVSQLYLNDTLDLEAGNLTLGSGGYLSLEANSVIRVNGGGMTLGTGIVENSNNYTVMYVGASKTTSYELNGSGLTEVWVDMDDNSQTVTLGGDVTINGTLHHNTGTIRLNGNELTLMDNYTSMSGAMFSGTSTSDLTITSTSSGLIGTIVFTAAGASLNNFWVQTASGAGNVNLGSNLTINGTLTLQHGNLNSTAGTLIMSNGSSINVFNGHLGVAAASFDGTGLYSLTYSGSSSVISGVELTGSGMNSLTIDLVNQTDSVEIMNDIVLTGSLTMENGTLDMNGHDVTISGTYSNGNMTGWFNGDANSDLTINSGITSTDTIMFNASNNHIHNLTINTGDGGYIQLGNDLWVENLTLTNGGVTLWDNNLTINSTGTITGANSDNYVMIMGDGYLNMHINNSSPYVMYPVGTDMSYSPVGLQQNSGTVGYFSVGVHNGVWSAGESGTNNAMSESVVDRTWDIEPTATGGSHNVNMIVQWDASMEVNGFDRTHSYISHYTAGAWDVQATSGATSVAGGMYQSQRMNITTFSPFAVVDQNSALLVHELAQANSVQLYPNPVRDYLNCIVNISEPTSVDLISLTGEVVHSEKLNGKAGVINHTIDFSGLPNGVYFIRFNNSTGASSYKIVKS